MDDSILLTMDSFEEFKNLYESHKIAQEKEEISILLEGQYKEAYETLEDAYNAGLYVGIIGPVGVGKTALCRKFASDHDIGFTWITFSDLIRPATLIGTFDPTLVFQKGFSIDSFIPGPFTRAALSGSIFFANEINRGEEYVLNTLLDALEERRLYIPQLKSWVKVDPNFFFIAAMNPKELRGTRMLPQAFKDRIGIWITLEYPRMEIEEKIIRLNVPEIDLDEEVIRSIIKIVSRTRNDPAVSFGGSIRASIAMARFLGERKKRLERSVNKEMIRETAILVLSQSVEFTPGIDGALYLDRIIAEELRDFKD